MDEIKISDFKNKSIMKDSPIILNRKKIESKKIYFFVKRVIDIFGSFFGLIFLSPLLIIIAFKIKKEDSTGPIFFIQERVGKNGKVFKMYKFRTMCVDAEVKLKDLLIYNEVDGAMFKIKDDPRITKFGKFLRKSSLDELPQLINVLKGDMSLVGPRPPLSREVLEYSEYDLQRLIVKPGCTGLWQISGRNDVGFNEMITLDLNYIVNMKIKNDLLIMLKTFFVIIKPKGAY
jgi:lipopolysaccharide/colanic/teichoic acid biosynthesis glycosyltransferase|nr:sugar transferase [Enterococcus casseliflavus]